MRGTCLLVFNNLTMEILRPTNCISIQQRQALLSVSLGSLNPCIAGCKPCCTAGVGDHLCPGIPDPILRLSGHCHKRKEELLKIPIESQNLLSQTGLNIKCFVVYKITSGETTNSPNSSKEELLPTLRSLVLSAAALLLLHVPVLSPEG